MSVYEAHLEQLNEGAYNLVQKGRVVPVKVTVECAGTPFTGLATIIQLLKGDFTAGSESAADEIETCRLRPQIRPNDSRYFYNLQVPSNAYANEIYTVRVRPFGNTKPSDARVILKIHRERELSGQSIMGQEGDRLLSKQ